MSTQKIITQLYVGYFNRAPDQGGFNYWISRANAGMPIVDIAQSFFVQPEAVAIYGGLDRVPLINLIYANLFRRSPDAAGLNYWLNNGQPIGRTIVDIISGAQGGDLHLLQLPQPYGADAVLLTAYGYGIPRRKGAGFYVGHWLISGKGKN